MSMFSQWNQIKPGFFHDTRQVYWLCTATLMFWLLSKSLAGVFERVGGGLVGETAGVDFAALAVSAAKTAAMALNRPKPVTETVQTTLNFNNYASMSGPGSSSPTPGGAKMIASAGGQASNDTYKTTSGSTKNGVNSTPNTSPKHGTPSNTTSTANQGAHGGVKVINFSDKQAENAGNKHTYPGMGKDKKIYKTGE